MFPLGRCKGELSAPRPASLCKILRLLDATTQGEERKNWRGEDSTSRFLRSAICRYNDRLEFRIRQFAKADFDTLWQIDQMCFDPQLAYSRPELAFYLRRPRSFTLVADAEEIPIRKKAAGSAANGLSSKDATAPSPVIVGFIVAEARRQTGHIITIDVVARARRSGVGSALLRMAENRLREHRAEAVELETAVNNEAAIRFYKQHGYFVEKTVRGYYSNQLDALVMRKALASNE